LGIIRDPDFIDLDLCPVEELRFADRYNI